MAMNLAESDVTARRHPIPSSNWSYLRGMEGWTAAASELFEHTAEVADGPSVRGQLLGARDDAAALHALLRTATRRHDPNPNATATIESICALWDANHPRFELLAAEADPAYYSLWRARTAMARLGKDGPHDADSLRLPFSS
ncbi:MAG: hypothetical protein ABL966_13150 [Acidimicrobiales bacterium]